MKDDPAHLCDRHGVAVEFEATERRSSESFSGPGPVSARVGGHEQGRHGLPNTSEGPKFAGQQATVRSTLAARPYKAGIWAQRIPPTPVLFIVALQNTITVPDLAPTAYEDALEPKQLMPLRGGHFYARRDRGRGRSGQPCKASQDAAG